MYDKLKALIQENHPFFYCLFVYGRIVRRIQNCIQTENSGRFTRSGISRKSAWSPIQFAQALLSSILALTGEMKNIQEKTVFSSFHGHTRSIVLKLIGLSGGPGNGKSAVAEIFREEGICVIDADKVCHAIYQEKDNDVITAMRQRWGKNIFDPEGFIDRRKIAEIVFNDDGERKFLDTLLHPAIFRRIAKIDEEL